nr:methyl-accepting chemotaxis protein [Bacillus sp. FJAT-45350]
MFKKIQNKLILLIVAILVSTLSIVLFVTYSQTKNVIETNAINEGENIVRELTRYGDLILEGYSNQLYLFSQNQSFIDYLTADEEEQDILWGNVDSQFDSLISLNDGIDYAYVASEAKHMRLTPHFDLPPDFDPTGRPWYVEAKQDVNNVIWTNPYLSEEGSIVVTAAKAVLDPSTGNVLGAIGLDITLDGLANMMSSIDVNYDGFVFLYDTEGTALVHPTLVGEDLSENETIKQMLAGPEIGSIYYDYEGLERMMYYETVSETGWKIGVVYVYKNLLTDANELRNVILIVSGIAIVISLVISYLFSIGITKPIKQLREQVSKIAAGDLTVQATSKSQDEVGELTRDFNHMAQQMKELLEAVQNSANEVSHSAETLNALSEESIASSEEISASVAEIASGSSRQVDDVEETKKQTIDLSNQIEEVKQETVNMEKLTSKTREVSLHGGKRVEVLKEKTKETNDVFLNVEGVISDLSARISEIENIIDTINDISAQTNLLALNASIEAARAGENGKGFAVVADEVRKLADQSSQATVKVRETINSIIDQSERAMGEISRTKEISVLQNEAVNETDKSFKDIEQSVNQIIDSISSVRDEIERMADNKEHVLESIKNISEVAQEASASVEEVNAASYQQGAALESVAQSADKLNEASTQLLELSKQFKVK